MKPIKRKDYKTPGWWSKHKGRLVTFKAHGLHLLVNRKGFICFNKGTLVFIRNRHRLHKFSINKIHNLRLGSLHEEIVRKIEINDTWKTQVSIKNIKVKL